MRQKQHGMFQNTIHPSYRILRKRTSSSSSVDLAVAFTQAPASSTVSSAPQVSSMF
jgi:hypothetical protein